MHNHATQSFNSLERYQISFTGLAEIIKCTAPMTAQSFCLLYVLHFLARWFLRFSVTIHIWGWWNTKRKLKCLAFIYVKRPLYIKDIRAIKETANCSTFLTNVNVSFPSKCDNVPQNVLILLFVCACVTCLNGWDVKFGRVKKKWSYEVWYCLLSDPYHPTAISLPRF